MLNIKRNNIIPNESKPYLIQITNNSAASIHSATIFGFDDLSNLPNFGNNVNVAVAALAPNTTYSRILAQSQSKPFRVCMYYLASATPANINQTLMLNYFDANGRSCSDPIPPIYTDPYQFQRGIIVFCKPTKIDGSMSITLPSILPTTSLILALFPEEIADKSNQFSGEPVVRGYNLPDTPAFRGQSIVRTP